MVRSTARLGCGATALVSIVWLGMLLGVSFLATPIKFQAPSLDLSVALEVGRVTFAAFSKVELLLAVLLSVSLVFARIPRAETAFSAVAILILLIEAFWLLPILDARVEAVIAGRPLPPSMHHMLYAGLETAKALTLAMVALLALYRLGWRDRRDPVTE